MIPTKYSTIMHKPISIAVKQIANMPLTKFSIRMAGIAVFGPSAGALTRRNSSTMARKKLRQFRERKRSRIGIGTKVLSWFWPEKDTMNSKVPVEMHSAIKTGTKFPVVWPAELIHLLNGSYLYIAAAAAPMSMNLRASNTTASVNTTWTMRAVAKSRIAETRTWVAMVKCLM